jgi:hypothetical protein
MEAKYPIQRENLRKLPDVGNVVVYKLLPKDSPTNPERLWRGRVAKVFSGTDCVEVAVLEQGYEGLTEIVMLSQIVTMQEE